MVDTRGDILTTSRPYRNFRKAYGGDPDTAILRDLHKRLTRVEINQDKILIGLQANSRALVDLLLRFPPPPPPPSAINVVKDHGLAEGQ